MSLTKRQLVEEAYEELALAPNSFNLQAEDIQAGLRRIESMLRTWLNVGVDTGYIFPVTPDYSDPNDESGILDMYDEAVRTNAAIRIAPLFGKAVSNETRVAAAIAYQAMLVPRPVPQMQLPRNLPVGAGNRVYGWGREYFRPCLPAGVSDPSVTPCQCAPTDESS